MMNNKHKICIPTKIQKTNWKSEDGYDNAHHCYKCSSFFDIHTTIIMEI